MMATKADVLRWIRALNRIYGMKVRFRTGTGWGGPSADVASRTLVFPPKENPRGRFYDPRIVAHEYAHLLREGTGPLRPRVHLREVAHDATFEHTYEEVCLHLGVFPTPTAALLREFRSQ